MFQRASKKSQHHLTQMDNCVQTTEKKKWKGVNKAPGRQRGVCVVFKVRIDRQKHGGMKTGRQTQIIY